MRGIMSKMLFEVPFFLKSTAKKVSTLKFSVDHKIFDGMKKLVRTQNFQRFGDKFGMKTEFHRFCHPPKTVAKTV